MKTKPWRISNSTNSGQLDVYVYGEISTTDDLDGGATAAAFVADLKAASPVSLVNLHINSPGGSVFAATSIHNTLRSLGARIVCTIDGLCASAATLVAMAAHTIAMPSNGMFMIHLPSISLFSAEAGELRKMADVLDRMTNVMIGMYQLHSTLSAERIRQFLVEESWFDAKAALSAGFITEISDESGDLSIAACADLSRFRKPPKQLIAARQRTPVPSVTQSDSLSMSELEAEHQRLLLQKRLQDARYTRN